ncbi:MAG: thymidylate kinase [Thermoplasmata archaeon]|nr:thymidylate kinase [Thermoplasmata archaeon]
MMKFIVVDGLDGCGKDTHAFRIKSLIERNDGSAIIISHPSKRLLGRITKRALTESDKISRLIATLFYTSDVILSTRMLKRGNRETIIFVRYLLGTAYLPKALAPYGYRFFRKLLPFPDIAFFIDIEPEIALRRIEARDHRREMFETLEKLMDVRKVAKSLISDEWVTINNSIEGEEPFNEVERILRERELIGHTLKS